MLGYSAVHWPYPFVRLCREFTRTPAPSIEHPAVDNRILPVLAQPAARHLHHIAPLPSYFAFCVAPYSPSCATSGTATVRLPLLPPPHDIHFLIPSAYVPHMDNFMLIPAYDVSSGVSADTVALGPCVAYVCFNVSKSKRQGVAVAV